MEKVIILTSFGVLDPMQREQCLDRLAMETAAAFPDYRVLQAYTSQFIRKRLQAAGEKVWGLPELLAELSVHGVEQVLVQPLHLTTGEEYDEKIVKPVQQWQSTFKFLRLGKPVLFWQDENGAAAYQVVLDTVLGNVELAAGEALVFMGHGSPHRHNPAYEYLQAAADETRREVHIGVLEAADTPSIQDVIARLQARHIQKVLLRPLLLTGGRHVTEDMAGGENSWRGKLMQAGFVVRTDLRGLGAFAAFRQLYKKQILQALQEE